MWSNLQVSKLQGALTLRAEQGVQPGKGVSGHCIILTLVSLHWEKCQHPFQAALWVSLVLWAPGGSWFKTSPFHLFLQTSGDITPAPSLLPYTSLKMNHESSLPLPKNEILYWRSLDHVK